MNQPTPVLDRFGRELKRGQWVAQPKARSGSASVDVAMVKEVNDKRDVRVVHFSKVTCIWDDRLQKVVNVHPPYWRRSAQSKINLTENLIIMDADVVAEPDLLQWIEDALGGDPFAELPPEPEQV